MTRHRSSTGTRSRQWQQVREGVGGEGRLKYPVALQLLHSLLLRPSQRAFFQGLCALAAGGDAPGVPLPSPGTLPAHLLHACHSLTPTPPLPYSPVPAAGGHHRGDRQDPTSWAHVAAVSSKLAGIFQGEWAALDPLLSVVSLPFGVSLLLLIPCLSAVPFTCDTSMTPGGGHRG